MITALCPVRSRFKGSIFGFFISNLIRPVTSFENDVPMQSGYIDLYLLIKCLPIKLLPQ